MSGLRVGTWNLNGWAVGQEAARAEIIKAEKLDLLCAQELSFSRFNALLRALGSEWWGVSSLRAREGLPSPSRYWGVAVLGRTGRTTLESANVIGDPQRESEPEGLFWRRTVVASVHVEGAGLLTVASAHVRPGAVVGGSKLVFVERMGAWMRSAPRPAILGVDANSPAGLGNEDGDYWGVEKDVWSAHATHGMKDAWRVAGTAFSPTHTIKRSGREARFDHIWISDEIDVKSLTHARHEPEDGGSDHALVVADVQLLAAG